MTDKPEVFGVVWRDLFLGGIVLTLNKPDAASAIECARGIIARAGGKMEAVQAVHIPAGSDAPVYLSLEA